MSQTAQPEGVCDLSNVSQWPWLTASEKFQRHSFKVAFKLTAKSARSYILKFGIFENRLAALGSYEDLIIRSGAGAAGAGTA